MSKIPKKNRGEIWLANLKPNRGNEPGKTRPVLIIQNQILLDVSHPTTVILPLSTMLIDKAYPLRVRVKAEGQLRQDSDVLIDQIHAIDNDRLVEGPLLQLNSSVLLLIEQAISELVQKC